MAAGFLFSLCKVCREHRAVRPTSRVNRRQGVKFDGATVFRGSLVGRGVVAQISTGELFLEGVLKVVGVAQQFMAVEEGVVDDPQNSTRCEFGGGDVDPRQVGVVGDDLPGPRGGVCIFVV